MFRFLCVVGAVSFASAALGQTPRALARPPAQTPPAIDSAAADGYAPIPEWLGQTRAPATSRRVTLSPLVTER